MRAAIYIRVSSDEQVDGWSLDAQRDQCRALAAMRKWTVVQLYEEPGSSAKTDQRPVFQQMMRAALAHRFDVIVVHKLDRFSRRLVDVVKNVELLKTAGVSLVSASEAWIDTTGGLGESFLFLAAIFAQLDNENRARETSKGKQARAKAGAWNGTLAFGYITLNLLKKALARLELQGQRDELDQETLSARMQTLQTYINQVQYYLVDFPLLTEEHAVPHPKNARGLCQAFDLYAMETFSDRDVAILLNEAGYRTSGNWGEQEFNEDTVRPMLQNRFYLGEVFSQGLWRPGMHPPLISVNLFDKCQEIRARRRGRTVRAASTKRVYPVSRLALCARCGQPMRGQAGSGHRYYRAPKRSIKGCGQRQVRADAVEAHLVDFLRTVHLPKDWKAQMVASNQPKRKQADQVARKRTLLERQLGRAKTLYQLGDITDAEYFALRNDLRGKLAALEPESDPDLEETAELLDKLPKKLEKAELKALEEIFHKLFRTIYLNSTRPGPVVAVEPRPMVSQLLHIATSPLRRKATNEHLGYVYTVVQTDEMLSKTQAEAELADEKNDDILVFGAGKQHDLGEKKNVAEHGRNPVAPAPTSTVKIPHNLAEFFILTQRGCDGDGTRD